MSASHEIKNLEDFRQVMAAAQANNNQGVLNMSPELEGYLAAHPPNGDLDAESKDLLEKLRAIFYAQQQSLASPEPATIIPGNEPGVFTSDRPLATVMEVYEAYKLFARSVPQGSKFDPVFTPELAARWKDNDF